MSDLLADASGEAIRLSNGTRWVRFPRRALRPSCVSGLRVRLKPGRSRFDSGGGHSCANRSMAERRHDEAEMSVRFALRAPRSIGGAVGTAHCLASRDKRGRLPPPPLPCRANGCGFDSRRRFPVCPRVEMDIMRGYEPRVGGSTPPGDAIALSC